MFAGWVAVITGGGSGIGAAMAAELRRQGATVVTADVRGGDVELDVRDRAAVEAVLDDVVARHGRLDLLFNNAGISMGGETHRNADPPADLPPQPPETLTGRQFLGVLKQKPISPEAFAGPALRGVARNQALIIVPASGKAMWYLHRLSPAAFERLSRYAVARVQRHLVASAGGR